jgi:hypothetical protein
MAHHDASALSSRHLHNNNSVTPPSATIRSGWNGSHPHYTRFKARLQANFTCVQAYIAPTVNRVPAVHPPVTDPFLSMIANIEAVHTLDDGMQNYMYPCAYTASSDTVKTL